MKRREFLISGVCTVGALVVARSIFASPERPASLAASASSRGYRLHGSSRTGCARLPGDDVAWKSLGAAVPPL